MSDKTQMNVRLPRELAAELRLVARIEGVHVNELIEGMANRELVRRRADPVFRERCRREVEQLERVAARLAR